MDRQGSRRTNPPLAPPDIVMGLHFEDLVGLQKNLDVSWFWQSWNASSNPPDWHGFIDTLADEDVERADGIRRRFLAYALDVAGTTCRPFCRFSDVGTQAPTSDIDVTVLNTRAMLISRLVNQLFQYVFLQANRGHGNLTMSKVFDINVYCNPYYSVCGYDGISILPIEACAPDRQLELNMKARIDQACWSMLRLVDVDWAWDGEADRDFRDGVRILWSSSKQCGTTGYEAAVEGAERILERLSAEKNQQSQNAADLRRRYVNAVSAVHVLEQDAYFSYGAFVHVVIGMQQGSRKVSLSRMDYIASFFDNLGFFAENLIKQQHDPPSLNMSVVKYFHRCAKALEAIEMDLDVELVKSASAAMDAKNGGFMLSEQNVERLIKIDSFRKALEPVAHALVAEVKHALVEHASQQRMSTPHCYASDMGKSPVKIAMSRGQNDTRPPTRDQNGDDSRPPWASAGGELINRTPRRASARRAGTARRSACTCSTTSRCGRRAR